MAVPYTLCGDFKICPVMIYPNVMLEIENESLRSKTQKNKELAAEAIYILNLADESDAVRRAIEVLNKIIN